MSDFAYNRKHLPKSEIEREQKLLKMPDINRYSKSHIENIYNRSHLPKSEIEREKKLLEISG